MIMFTPKATGFQLRMLPAAIRALRQYGDRLSVYQQIKPEGRYPCLQLHLSGNMLIFAVTLLVLISKARRKRYGINLSEYRGGESDSFRSHLGTPAGRRPVAVCILASVPNEMLASMTHQETATYEVMKLFLTDYTERNPRTVSPEGL